MTPPDEDAAVRMIIIDVYACGVKAGEAMNLAFLIDGGNTGYSEAAFIVENDLTIRIPFSEIDDLLGVDLNSLATHIFRIDAADTGEYWENTIPAIGNIKAELV